MHGTAIQMLVMGTFLLHFGNTTLSSNCLRPIQYLYGIVECELILHLGLAHFSAQNFSPYRTPIILICTTQIINMVVPVEMKASEGLLLWVSLLAILIGTINKEQSE